MSQTNVLQGKSSKEKIVKSADKVLKTISKSLMIDQQVREIGFSQQFILFKVYGYTTMLSVILTKDNNFLCFPICFPWL